MSHRPSQLLRFAAWATHAFTASGMLAGFAALVAFAQPSPDHFRSGWIWLIVAFVIDGIDGTFARLFRVKETLPHMNGTMIDSVVDFANYALIPLFFMYQAGLLPENWEWTGIGIALLASGLYYGKDGMIAEDKSFVGFPVLWNLVAFYLYFVFHWSPWVNLTVVILLSVAHFIPIKYLYPSRGKRFFWMTLVISVMVIGADVALLLMTTNAPGYLLAWWGAVIGLMYFVVMSLVWTFSSPKHKIH